LGKIPEGIRPTSGDFTQLQLCKSKPSQSPRLLAVIVEKLRI